LLTLKDIPHRGSLTRFIIIWVATLIVTSSVLAGAMLLLTQQLESLTKDAVRYANGSQDADRLVTEILVESREDLQYRISHADSINTDKLDALQKVQVYVIDLTATAETDSERTLVAGIRDSYHDFYSASVARVQPEFSVIHALTDSLLADVDDYRALKVAEMEGAIARNFGLRDDMRMILIILILSNALIILIGSVLLVKRIITPTIALSTAADRFGQGDFSARVEVFRNDELGDLSRTFNNMAEDIARREKSRSEFTATVFHDIKNPLVIIGAAIRMIRKKSLNRAKTEEWLDRVLREVDRLEDLSQDLMDIVQVQSGQLSLQMADVDFTDLVSRIHAEHLDAVTSHVIEFKSSGECKVLGDRRRLERVVINLLSNAMKYSPEGTTIIMKLERVDSKAVFSITDQGVGISPEEQKVLFQPFGRVERTRDMARGTGLGLYIVKKIIEAHGGSVRVQSSLGLGTMVELTLPVV
jgi:signal transduction histidine kinase